MSIEPSTDILSRQLLDSADIRHRIGCHADDACPCVVQAFAMALTLSAVSRKHDIEALQCIIDDFLVESTIVETFSYCQCFCTELRIRPRDAEDDGSVTLSLDD